MAWTTDQYKAIVAYAKKNDLRVSMCSHPNARFMDKDGNFVVKHISDVVLEYQRNKKDEATERRRLKNEEDKRANGSKNPSRPKSA